MNRDNCKKYCSDYLNCNRTKCDRVPLFKYGKEIVMVAKEEGAYWDYQMKKLLFSESRVTKLN